jgi:hypothetical protein
MARKTQTSAKFNYKIGGISAKYYAVVAVCTILVWGALPFFGVFGNRNIELILFIVLGIYMILSLVRWLMGLFRKAL